MGAELDVEVSGEGPPLVWGHALLASMEAERRSGLFDWSGAGARLIRYDARSHGRSPDADGVDQQRWESLAIDMLNVAAARGVPTAVFGGASMGAATALWAAHLAPERVRGLILVIPPTAWESRFLQRVMYGGAGFAASARLLAPLTFGLRFRRSRPEPGTREALTAAVFDQVSRSGARRIGLALRGAARSDLPPLGDLERIDAPTLILAWPGDRTHPLGVARELASAMPNAELHIAADDLSAWPEMVRDFMAEVPAPT